MTSAAPSGAAASGSAPLLEAQGLKTWFPVSGGVMRKTVGHVKAVNDVTFSMRPGEVLSVVGESGCGKSTLGYSLLGLVPPTAGRLSLAGKAVDIRRTSSWNPYRKDFQIVFQDPYTSLNPRHTVFETLAEPMRAHGICPVRELPERVAGLLGKVGLSPDYMHRFPHAFSGGQRQRIGIARAIGLNPKLLVCDEVVAALDVSVQAQIIRLLMDLKAELGLSLLFISHDLSLVKSISDRVLVMYLGKIAEAAAAPDLFAAPRHPYTAALLESIPTLDRSRRPKLLGGEIPSPVNLPEGCAFAGRCPRAQDRCRQETPVLFRADRSEAACFYPVGLPPVP
ncbi:MAG TPA: oligopeptide/dipeptide ABC transporter ATP-binding protein [Fibrobacteria bacterium]|nr:oligopeptide/dipeptide ABC transporter ATP-binding protein [Fibrobacteria bacterium]